jgi:hypothetical protein
MSLKLKEEFQQFKCENPENRYTKECNEFLLKKEVLERENYEKEEKDNDSALYPSLDDPNFIIKIAEKKTTRTISAFLFFLAALLTLALAPRAAHAPHTRTHTRAGPMA